MLTVYKLTDQNLQTFGRYQWTIGEWREAPGIGPLCAAGWLHYYEDPLLAMLLNPTHAGIKAPRLWEAETDGLVLRDGDLKAGTTRLRLVRELELPVVTTTQRVAFAILTVWPKSGALWREWATRWLSGEDRTASSARATRRAARGAEWETTQAAVEAAWAAAAWAEAEEVAPRAKWATWAAATAARAAEAAATAWPDEAQVGLLPGELLHCAFRAMEY